MMYRDLDERRGPITPQLAIRVAIIGGVCLVMFGVIFFRLWYLQVLSGDKYLAEANNNQVRDITVQAPRGASTRIVRVRLLFASARYLSPESTCRYQRRKKITANITRATPPRIATRRAKPDVICGRRSSFFRYICGQAPITVGEARRRTATSSIRAGRRILRTAM